MAASDKGKKLEVWQLSESAEWPDWLEQVFIKGQCPWRDKRLVSRGPYPPVFGQVERAAIADLINVTRCDECENPLSKKFLKNSRQKSQQALLTKKGCSISLNRQKRQMEKK